MGKHEDFLRCKRMHRVKQSFDILSKLWKRFLAKLLKFVYFQNKKQSQKKIRKGEQCLYSKKEHTQMPLKKKNRLPQKISWLSTPQIESLEAS